MSKEPVTVQPVALTPVESADAIAGELSKAAEDSSNKPSNSGAVVSWIVILAAVAIVLYGGYHLVQAAHAISSIQYIGDAVAQQYPEMVEKWKSVVPDDRIKVGDAPWDAAVRVYKSLTDKERDQLALGTNSLIALLVEAGVSFKTLSEEERDKLASDIVKVLSYYAAMEGKTTLENLGFGTV